MPQTRVAGWESRVGRQDELEKTGTGEATIFIHDVDGLYDPWSLTSPHATELSGAPVSLNIRNPVTNTSHQRFRGYVEEYSYDYSGSGFNTEVAIRCVDAFDYLSTAEMAPYASGSQHGFPLPAGVEEGCIFYEDAEVDSRIHALLNDAGWPEELRVIFSGNVIVSESVYDAGYSFLAALQDAADSEWPGVANIFVEHSTGKVAFHGRHARFSPDSVAGPDVPWNFTRWKAGDGAAVHADIANTAQIRTPLAADYSMKMVYNDATITPLGILEEDIAGQRSTDPTSIAQYGTRSYTALDIRILEHKTNGNTGLDETKLMADYYVANFSQPRWRPRQISFKALHPDDPRAPAVWALMCGVEISDIVNLKLNVSGGGVVDEDYVVEGITTVCRPLQPEFDYVEVTLDVSPQAYYATDPFDD